MTKRIETQQKLMLRLPPELHQVAKKVAKDQNRSLNAEIIYRLKRAYIAEGVNLEAA